MDYRPLGRTDVKVSAICLGTMTWGEQNTLQDAHEQMDYALDAGVNFWDTAELYAVPPKAETQGRTEEYIGAWFRERKKRDKVVLATKVVGSGISWIRGGGPVTAKGIAAAIEGSLKRLQTDYIDLYQIHWPNRPATAFGAHWNLAPAMQDAAPHRDGILEILQALGKAQQEGKIRHAGLSNETAWGTMQYLQLAERHNLPRVVSIQNEYSLLNRIFEPETAEVAAYGQVGLLAWSPLGGGMLSGKYLDGARPPNARWTRAGNRFAHRDTPAANAAVKAYMRLAKEHGLDVCQMALAFVTGRPFTTSTIIGATTMEQLKTDIGSINVRLTPEVAQGIEKIRREFPAVF